MTGVQTCALPIFITRLDEVVEEVQFVRNQAKKQIEIAQYKQKEMYDKHVRYEDHFNIRQKVLYYHASQEGRHTGKLLPK